MGRLRAGSSQPWRIARSQDSCSPTLPCDISQHCSRFHRGDARQMREERRMESGFAIHQPVALRQYLKHFESDLYH